MAVKQALLALLAVEESTASNLQAAFHQVTGDTQPLNMGQVSQTLERLERDGFITQTRTGTGNRGQTVAYYALTPTGSDFVQQWYQTPVAHVLASRDELVTKIALATSYNATNVLALLDSQRNSILKQLRKLHTSVQTMKTFPERIVYERHIYELEAEARWLDRVEALLGEQS